MNKHIITPHSYTSSTIVYSGMHVYTFTIDYSRRYRSSPSRHLPRIGYTLCMAVYSYTYTLYMLLYMYIEVCSHEYAYMHACNERMVYGIRSNGTCIHSVGMVYGEYRYIH